jgi:hypothetical protein
VACTLSLSVPGLCNKPEPTNTGLSSRAQDAATRASPVSIGRACTARGTRAHAAKTSGLRGANGSGRTRVFRAVDCDWKRVAHTFVFLTADKVMP